MKKPTVRSPAKNVGHARVAIHAIRPTPCNATAEYASAAYGAMIAEP